jgi:hypothetical protein
MQVRRGLFVADAVAGLLIISVLGVALVTAVTRSTRAHDKLADSAMAAQLAQQALSFLQEGKSLPRDITVTVGALKVDAPPGFQWVEVNAAHGGRHATLIGLAKKGALP